MRPAKKKELIDISTGTAEAIVFVTRKEGLSWNKIKIGFPALLNHLSRSGLDWLGG